LIQIYCFAHDPFIMSASPLRVLAAAGLAAAASAASRMLVNQSEAYAIYDSVGTTVVGGNPFFAFADGLNPPAFADLFDGTSGSLVWSFTNASGTTGTPTFLVDTARHCEPSSGPDSAADVFVAVFDGAGASVYGLSSAAATAAPLWAVSLPGCGENIEGGTYIMMEASDSGNRVAIQCHHAGTPATARVYSIAGQTGIVEWSYDLGASVQAGQGNVQVTTDGAFVLFVNEQGTPTPNTASAFVLDGATGARRRSSFPSSSAPPSRTTACTWRSAMTRPFTCSRGTRPPQPTRRPLTSTRHPASARSRGTCR
jgi:hypothetical protein